MGLVNNFDLGKLKQEYNCNIFVETGTFKGDGVAHALKYGFDKIYSIEIFDDLALECKARFDNESTVEIIHASSYDGIESILDKLEGNCIFWLDAHFPGSDIGVKAYDEEKDDKINMPLLEELKLLAHRDGDVILIDDLRTFKEVPDQFKSKVNGFNEHMISIGQDHVKKEDLVSFDLDVEISNLFPNHEKHEQWLHSGYLSLMPKT